MTKIIAVAVECYSGHTYAERPIAFTWNGQRYQIKETEKQWRSPDGFGFRAVTTDGAHIELGYSNSQDQWSVHLQHSKWAHDALPPSDTANSTEQKLKSNRTERSK